MFLKFSRSLPILKPPFLLLVSTERSKSITGPSNDLSIVINLKGTKNSVDVLV